MSVGGRSLYAANFNNDGDGSLTSYKVDAGGTLGPARGPVLTGGKQPDLTSITLGRQPVDQLTAFLIRVVSCVSVAGVILVMA
jgi:hypothetical protein